MTEIQIRNSCPACRGTGKNKLTWQEAYNQLDKMPLGGFIDNSPAVSTEMRIQELQRCKACCGGWVYHWVSLNEVLSRGVG